MASKSSKVSKKAALLESITEASRALSAVTVMFHQAMADRMGLNATEHKCADILVRSGPVTAGQLAELTGLTTGAITGIVDRLEKAGYVRREKDPNDRRRVIIQPSLAPERAAYLGGLFESLNQAVARLTANYTEGELDVILDFLQRSATMMHDETHKLRALPDSPIGKNPAA
jgi:DNA-binding MarR family transcriptional regulator